MFNLLFYVSTVISIVAIVRLRPTTFLFAANQVLVLRSLQNISSFGQPVSQSMLPAELFSPDRLNTAGWIMAIPTTLLAISVLVRIPNKVVAYSPKTLPRWLVWLSIGQIALLLLSTRTIFATAYTAQDQVVFENLFGGGIQILAFGILIYEGYRRISNKSLSAAVAYAGVVAALIGTDFAKGSTGLATGIAFTGAAVFYSKEPSPRMRFRHLAIALVVLASLAILVRGVRSTLYQEGASAVGVLVERVVDEEKDTAGRGEGAEQFGNGTQYAAHILECIDLYDSGRDREWRSIYLPIEYTFKPSFLVRLLGLERSKEAAWELADNFIHGGGIYLWGELYWNGGYLCVAVVGAALIWFAFMCDTRFRSSSVWLVLLLQFGPGLLQGVGYGFAQVARGLFNGLILLALVKAFGKAEGKSKNSENSGAPTAALRTRLRTERQDCLRDAVSSIHSSPDSTIRS